ncbi:MAG: SDR family oxidoreductase [Acetobacteraceae bacterium]
MSTTASPPLSGKTAIVVGASSGIGLATALAFHDRGATVHALARRHQLITKVAAGQIARGHFFAHSLDATDPAAVEATMTALTGQSDVDVVVYAAGLNVPRRAVAELAPGDWDAIVRVNLSGAFYMITALLPGLRRCNGTVILISSASARWTNVSGAAYQASKAGLVALAAAGAHEEHVNGVRFSVLMPGVVDTPHLRRRKSLPSPQLLANALQPEDVAEVCLFLASLPPRAYVPELILLPTKLQAPGKTDERIIKG